jgi:serine/threonine-protein kinase
MGDDPASIMYQHVQTAPVPPSDLRPGLAGDFEALLFWLLAKDPAQRPTAAQVAEGATPPVDVMSKTITMRTRRSRKVLATAGVTLSLALAATVGILLDANTAKLPATSDLKPGPGITTPAGKPSMPPSVPTSTPVRATPAPSPKQTAGPQNPIGKRDAAETSTPAKPDNPGKSGGEKPKKPKKTKA